jgi:hypothetical protein
MAALSVPALLLSGWAVVLLRATLTATRDAVKEAKAATDVAREMSIAQARAYVFVSKAEVRRTDFTGKLPDLGEFPYFKVVLTVENSGITPAVWFELEGVTYLRIAVEGDIEARESAPFGAIRWGTVSHGAPLAAQFGGDDAWRQMIEAGGLQPYLFGIEGVVRYRTEFKEIRETAFAFTIEGRRLRDAQLDATGRTEKRRLPMIRPALLRSDHVTQADPRVEHMDTD